MTLILGLMSGTSLDGIDASLLDFHEDGRFDVIGHHYQPYPNDIHKTLATLSYANSIPTEEDSAAIDILLAEQYANAFEAIVTKPNPSNTIAAIANHGQTVYHAPPISIQLGSNQHLANLTQTPVIGHFRQADLQHGGQGAPLMPAFHKALLSNGVDEQKPSCVINLGGIANITLIESSDSEDSVIGYDTGPANTLMDQWIQKTKGLSYDNGGEWAKSGKVIDALLNKLLDDPYFKQDAPKSTGTDYFNLSWLAANTASLAEYPAQDVQATLLELSCESLSREIELHSQTKQLYLSGGGAHNTYFKQRLGERLPQHSIQLIDNIGIPAEWVESCGFAWLGYQFLTNTPSNLPSVTGANRHVVLGEQFLPAQLSTRTTS